jgi:prophage maintenance system killer protein
MVWRPEVEDFIEAHDIAGQISEIRTPGLKMSTEKGIQKIVGIIEETGKYSDPYEIAAAILVEGINKHPFNDGNHRTMWIVAKQTLRNNDEQMLVTELKDFDSIEEDLKSEVKFKDISQVANWIKTGEFK